MRDPLDWGSAVPLVAGRGKPGGHVNRRRPNRPSRIVAGKDSGCGENAVAASGQCMVVEPSLRDRLRGGGPDALAALGDGRAQAVYRYRRGWPVRRGGGRADVLRSLGLRQAVTPEGGSRQPPVQEATDRC